MDAGKSILMIVITLGIIALFIVSPLYHKVKDLRLEAGEFTTNVFLSHLIGLIFFFILFWYVGKDGLSDERTFENLIIIGALFSIGFSLLNIHFAKIRMVYATNR